MNRPSRPGLRTAAERRPAPTPCRARTLLHVPARAVYGPPMTTTEAPSADIVFDTLFAYQRSAALKAALDLDLFSVIEDGANTVAALATRCGASERGVRILCDYLTTIDLLEKSGSTYTLPPTSAAFLS